MATRTRSTLVAHSGIEMGAAFPPLCCTPSELLLTLSDFTCDLLHCSYRVQSTSACRKRGTSGRGGDVMFVYLPRSRTSGSCQGESGFPSPEETCVLVFGFLVAAGDIVIPFWLGCEFHDGEAEVGRGVF